MMLPFPSSDLEQWARDLTATLQLHFDEDAQGGQDGGGSTTVIVDRTGRTLVDADGLYVYDASGVAVVSANVVTIDTSHLVDAAIATSKLADGAVTTTKIGAAAIGTAQIANAAITSALIGDLAVVEAKIADLAVTNAKIFDLSVQKLTSGTIASADIVVATSGRIRSGQTAYDTGTGWWLGADGGTPKFSIGSGTGNKLTWDGSALSITGVVTITGSSSVSGNLTVGSGAALRSGKTAYSDTTNAGWWIGSDSGTPKIRIGNAGHTAGLTWDGSALGLTGSITASTVTGGTVQTATSGQRVVLSGSANQAQFFGNRGDGTTSLLATIGNLTNSVVATFGATAAGTSVVGLQALSNSGTAFIADSVSGKAITAESDTASVVVECITSGSGIAVSGVSTSGYGGQFSGGLGGIRIVPSASASAPSHSAGIGALHVTSAGVLYINTSGSTTWAKVGAQ